MARYLLDASALLAWIQREPGADVVDKALPEAAVSSVNLAEVGAKLSDFGVPARKLSAALDFEIEVISFDAQSAMEAGRLRSGTRRLGLSLGDRCCLATAKQYGLIALTTDRDWSSLNLKRVKVRVIR